jgi:hypothetical protein
MRLSGCTRTSLHTAHLHPFPCLVFAAVCLAPNHPPLPVNAMKNFLSLRPLSPTSPPRAPPLAPNTPSSLTFSPPALRRRPRDATTTSPITPPLCPWHPWPSPLTSSLASLIFRFPPVLRSPPPGATTTYRPLTLHPSPLLPLLAGACRKTLALYHPRPLSSQESTSWCYDNFLNARAMKSADSIRSQVGLTTPLDPSAPPSCILDPIAGGVPPQPVHALNPANHPSAPAHPSACACLDTSLPPLPLYPFPLPPCILGPVAGGHH